MTTTLTYGAALAAHNIAVPDHLIADAEVPVLDGAQRQGDLLILPTTRDTAPLAGLLTQVPAGGVQVVVGEATGNTHWLDADGDVAWARTSDGLSEGVVAVADGATAWLTHTDEHGCNGIAPGVYEIRRQREQADAIRVVAD